MVWVSFAIFPYPITSFFLQAMPDYGMKAADLHIEQVDTIQADKPTNPCQSDLRFIITITYFFHKKD